jgi:hypothetical protein
VTIETPRYDSYAAQDTFCTGLARIERLGPCRRLVFYSITTDHNGATERQVVGKLVMTAEVMQQIAALLFQDMPDKALDEPRSMAAH